MKKQLQFRHFQYPSDIVSYFTGSNIKPENVVAITKSDSEGFFFILLF